MWIFLLHSKGKGWSVRPLLFEMFKEKLLILAIDRNSLNSQILHLFVSILYCVMLVFWQWGINIVFLLIFGKVHNNYKFMTRSRLKGYIVQLLSYKWGQWVDVLKKSAIDNHDLATTDSPFLQIGIIFFSFYQLGRECRKWSTSENDQHG